MQQYPGPNPEIFYPIVWDILRQVPHGVVTTFGQIASMIPTPDGIDPTDYQKLGPRWVGDATGVGKQIAQGDRTGEGFAVSSSA